MVVGCVIFTLPHFLSPTPNSAPLNRLESKSLPASPSASNSYITSRLTQLETEIYSAQLPNSTFPPLNVTGVTPIEAQSLWGKNSVCHSQNPPPPSKFISSATSRPGEDPEVVVNPIHNVVEYPTVQREKVVTTPAGCEMEKLEDGTLKTVEPESFAHPLILFTLAQILLGVGGSPLFTLGITYVDDHVPKASSSIYIGKGTLSRHQFTTVNDPYFIFFAS